MGAFQPMDVLFRTINAFIEDTSVLAVIAYLLARGRLQTLLLRERLTGWEIATLGATFGLAALTEAAFPGARFPYTTHTLVVTFGTLTGGLPIGLTAAAVVTVGELVFNPMKGAVVTSIAVFLTALLVGGLRRLIRTGPRLAGAFAAGVISQSCTFLFWLAVARPPRTPELLSHGLVSIPANGFGALLLLLVVDDAQVRARSERHRLEAERTHTLLAEGQLNALRSRIHPHFLFNTLSSIAGLCGVAPERAEAAIVRLGELMRRALEADGAAPAALADEIEHARAYLEIEQLRLGDRLSVIWSVDSRGDAAPVPPFAVQTLVENAVRHGIAPKIGRGTIRITVSRSAGHTLVAVADDGVGMPTPPAAGGPEAGETRLHGLQILTRQLVLRHGPRGRLRCFSRAGHGTLVVFRVPELDGVERVKGGELC